MYQNDFFVALIHTDVVKINDQAHLLPPHNGRFMEFKVADYYCPEEWSKDGIFVEVKEGQPLWFDFRRDRYSSTNWDCAVLCSVQKVNPVTGERIDLEAGLTKEPVQNYLRLPEQLWLDGYADKGKVYQFIITKAGIQAAVNEFVLPEFDQDSHALALAFFRAKKPKALPRPPVSSGHKECYLRSLYGSSGVTGPVNWGSFTSPNLCRGADSEVYISAMQQLNTVSTELGTTDSCVDSVESVEDFNEVDSDFHDEQQEEFDKASMAAGGRIKQAIVTDNNTVDYYEDKPTAILKVYIAFPEEFEAIMKKGKRQDEKIKDKYRYSGKIGGIQVPLTTIDGGRELKD